MPAGSSGTCHVSGLDGSRKPLQKLTTRRTISKPVDLQTGCLFTVKISIVCTKVVPSPWAELELTCLQWHFLSHHVNFLLLRIIIFLFFFFLGFVGQNCEIDVDACALANSSCPPGTQCLDLPDSLEYTCRVPCPQSLQVGENPNDPWSHKLLFF